MEQPQETKTRFSIITVVFNGEKTIRNTIQSVLDQDFTNYEYWIIDGNSRDATLSIIKSYTDRFNGRLKWISENDLGIYDAMNKGIEFAKGEIIHILNADDCYDHTNVLSEVSRHMENGINLLCGTVQYGDETRFTMLKYKNEYQSSIPHPGLFVRSSFYHRYGNYNICYKFAADIDFFLRIPSNEPIKVVDSIFVRMSSGGAGNSIRCLNEGISIFWKYRKLRSLAQAIFIEYPRRFSHRFRG